MKTILITALSAILFSAQGNAAEKPAIVLVHGAFETAAIWSGVAVGLEKAGYKTVAVNLPGRPGNLMPAGETSLSAYRSAVLKAIDSVKAPVILVGHSFGGIVISGVAEAAPSKIKTLVYIAAYLPKDGQSLVSLANADKDSKAGPSIQFLKDKGLASMPVDLRGGLFVNDGNSEQKKIVTEGVVDEPLPPLAEPVHLTSIFAKVPKVYIRTKRDLVVSPAAQSAMLAATKVREVLEVDSGHTPFITAGPALVEAILKTAR